MQDASTPEFFIKTLAEFRDKERERKNAALRLNISAYVNRLFQDFGGDFRGGRSDPVVVSIHANERPPLSNATRRFPG